MLDDRTTGADQAGFRRRDDTVRRVITPRLPDVAVSDEQLAQVQEYYLHRYFRLLPAPEGPQEPPASLPVSPRP